MIPKDKFNQEIYTGDSVIFTTSYRGRIAMGMVHKITAQNIIVKGIYNRWISIRNASLEIIKINKFGKDYLIENHLDHQ